MRKKVVLPSRKHIFREYSLKMRFVIEIFDLIRFKGNIECTFNFVKMDYPSFQNFFQQLQLQNGISNEERMQLEQQLDAYIQHAGIQAYQYLIQIGQSNINSSNFRFSLTLIKYIARKFPDIFGDQPAEFDQMIYGSIFSLLVNPNIQPAYISQVQDDIICLAQRYLCKENLIEVVAGEKV